MTANTAWVRVRWSRALFLITLLAAIASCFCTGVVVVIPADLLIAYNPVILSHAEVVGVEVGDFPLMMSGCLLYSTLLLLLTCAFVWWKGVHQHSRLVTAAIEREQAERAQFQQYLDNFNDLLLNAFPLPSDSESEVWLRLRLLTMEASHTMRGRWQLLLLHFLSESGLQSFLKLPSLAQGGLSSLELPSQGHRPTATAPDYQLRIARTVTVFFFIAAGLFCCCSLLASLSNSATDIPPLEGLYAYRPIFIFISFYTWQTFASLAFLAGVGVWWLFGRKEPLREQLLSASHKHQTDMLQGYLRRLRLIWPQLLQHPSPRGLAILNAQTRMLVRELEPPGKSILIRELYQDGLLGDSPSLSLDGVNLSQVTLDKTILRGIRLDRSNLTGASFAQAVLQQASLDGCILTQVDLRGADLSEATLRGADLSRALLHRATLTRADFTGATLTGANLWGVAKEEIETLLTPDQQQSLW